MSSDNLDEYRAKLLKSRQQLKKVKQLLTQQPHNENLINVCHFMYFTISVTTNPRNLIISSRRTSKR